MARTGAQYIAALRDGRTVYVNGERVADVTEHPAFRRAVQSVAHLYDLAASPEHRDTMTFPSPATGEPVNKCFLIPRTMEDLTARRAAHRLWADATFGFLGRSPDHVPGFITGFAMRPDLFARQGQRFGDNVVRYHAWLRDRDLYAAYVIIPPHIDRSRPAHQQEDPHLYAGVVEERSDGIVVSGAQMLGTGGAIADEMFMSCIVPLVPGDENYALSFAVPVASPGLRLIVRRPYAESAPSVFDYPLSSRFDETDALVVFDRVFVPWERVFVYKDVPLTRAQFYETPAHVLGNFQAQVRFTSKAQFLAGIALRIAESIGVDRTPQTQTMLGELASYCAMASGLVLAAETACVQDPRGFVYPNATYLYANNWLQATYHETMLTYVRELAGGGLLQVPSSYKDYLNPEIAADLERFVRSPGLKSVERTKLYKLAWDLVGSEFAGRHQQYELFYAGARAQTTAVRAYRAFDFAAARAMVDRCLAGYDLPAPPPAGG
ncbi:MAG TPA: 4-hydroxyphenylacetate 3-hydroxylase N-terminal domain-containing protein [Candidatus Bathyarchaeia archaeon]|nr:4-hydroxyphenylacetate 3-hydroxylase N-terminal domain-containing protein [Candidatus Bathyarchaeia archaeon]